MSISEVGPDHAQLSAADGVQRVQEEGLGLSDLVCSDITGGAKALTIPAALVERTL